MPQNHKAIYQQWQAQARDLAGLQKLFLLGCIKSGTTWLMNLLNAHPQIVVRGEGAFAWRLLPMLSQGFAAFNRQQASIDGITHLRDEELSVTLRVLIDRQFARYVEASGRPIGSLRLVGDKTPQHTVGMTALAELFTEARFVHVIRDPRDAATSAWFHFGRREERTLEAYVEHFITHVWPLNVTSARGAAAGLPGLYHELRYEDLHRDEAGELQRLFAFLGVDSKESVIAAAMRSASFEKQSGGRPRGAADPGSLYRSGTVGDWRNHLPEAWIERCCAQIAPLMRACGYEPGAARAVA